MRSLRRRQLIKYVALLASLRAARRTKWNR
nr:MAG TPA: hypothetical protein [Caudoviricetes sp.]